MTVRSRKADAAAVQSSIEPARAKFLKVYGTEPPSVTMDEEKFLPEAPGESTANSVLLQWV